MSELNVELLKQIRDKIAATPEAYDQTVYGRASTVAPCGTAACIAGWACVLSGKVPLERVKKIADEIEIKDYGTWKQIPEVAQEVLGLSDDDAAVLFTGEPEGEWSDYDDGGNDVYEDGWPEPFKTQWRNAKVRERSAIAVDYLNHIIKTGKVTE